MDSKEKEVKVNKLWEELFELQHRAANEGPLCLLDQLTFNDIKLQLKELDAIK